MWKFIRFNRVNFSAFYFANLWFCFTGYFVLGDQLRQVASYVQNLVIKDLNQSSSPATLYYWSLIAVYLIVITITMLVVMKPLNIHIPDTKIEMWEQLLTCFLVAGFFFYSFHKIFSLGMPEGVPGQIVKLIMGQNAYYIESTRNVENISVIWSTVSDFVWNFCPLGFMWWRAKTGGAQG
jgi:glucan phosphoethanolaminetransferase (alkaline phosphatase superfamily)